jgi:hypothetical protein
VLDGISSIYYTLDSSKGDDVQFRTNAFDIWVFRRDPDAVRYLLLHTSQEKADRWFNGGCFWQIPGDFVAENESIVAASRRCLAQFGITASSLWAVEHTYTIYNQTLSSFSYLQRKPSMRIPLRSLGSIRSIDGLPLPNLRSSCVSGVCSMVCNGRVTMLRNLIGPIPS